MDLLTNNNSPEKEKTKKIIKIIIILLVIMFIAVIITGGSIYYLKSKEFKVLIDGSAVTSMSSDTIIIQNGKCYVSIKDIAPYIGYTSYNGEYKKYSEDSTSCYLQGSNEVVTYSLDSKTLYKTIITDEEIESKNSTSSTGIPTISDDYEYYTIEEPVKMINNKLYVSAEGIGIGTNIQINYDSNKNSVTIYTLPYLAKYYTNQIPNSAVADEEALFSNKKALLYGMLVVKDATDEKSPVYGVVDLNNSEIIGKKYTAIKFIESTQEFIVLTAEGKMGIISKDATTKIKPEYDQIKQIDKDTGLYLVSNNKKYGVVNNYGKIVIYLEYDSIGIDLTKFSDNNIKNTYLLYDNCIPVQKDKLWGMMDKNGKTLLPVEFESFGCIVGTSTDKLAKSLLLVPEYEAIVACKDKLYGLYNSIGKELIAPAVTDMYMITSSGESTYYLTYNGTKINIIDYLKSIGIQPVDKTKNDITNTSNNNEVNQNTTEESNNNQIYQSQQEEIQTQSTEDQSQETNSQQTDSQQTDSQQADSQQTDGQQTDSQTYVFN